MEEFGQLLAGLMRIALIPLLGYAIVRLARRWPRATLSVLLTLIAAGAGALGYAWHDGFSVPLDTRKLAFQSDAGQSVAVQKILERNPRRNSDAASSRVPMGNGCAHVSAFLVNNC